MAEIVAKIDALGKASAAKDVALGKDIERHYSHFDELCAAIEKRYAEKTHALDRCAQIVLSLCSGWGDVPTAWPFPVCSRR
jgi:hypothetical protein